MQNQTISSLHVIEEIVARYAPKRKDKTPLTRETRLAEDLAIDSPRMIDIVLEVEDRFGISLEDVDVQTTATVGELLDLVEQKRN